MEVLKRVRPEASTAVQEARGVLYLGARRGEEPSARGEDWRRVALDPARGGAWLEQAQAALWELRGRCGWICVAADALGAGLAASLAAQLPVERLALSGSALFVRKRRFERGPAARLERFARRNLSLVVSEVVLVAASEREIRGFASLLRGGRVCALERCGENFLTAPWAEINENNLLLSGKCV